MRKVIGILGFALAVFISNSSNAAPCAGFTDVDSASVFCPNVEWLKNRSITLGCNSSTLFCPNDSVIRLSMAAFLNRLGNALEPAFVHRAQSGASSVVNAGGVVCQTSPYAVTGYPRVATASTMFYHLSSSTETVDTQVMYSLDGGTTWNSFGDFITSAGNVPNAYMSQTPVAAPLFLSPGQSAMFGIQTSGGATTTDAGCEMTVRLDSHTGAGSPYDVVPEAAQGGLQTGR
jgi:hypothetical protein